jgi:uncharacterized protein
MYMAQVTALPSADIRVTMNTITEPYWQATKKSRLLGARCGQCRRFRMPPGPFCPNCLSLAIDWTEIKGPGTVYTYTVCQMPATDETAAYTYAPALIEFAEAPGIRFAGNLVGMDSADIRIDMPVITEWQHTLEGWGVPVFRAAAT